MSNEESGGNCKRSRTSEDGDYSTPSNTGTPSTGSSTSESLFTNEVVAEIRALRQIRDHESEVMSKLRSARIELELEKEKRKAMKRKEVMLVTLLGKEFIPRR